MSYRLQIHVTGEDPVVVDVDQLPQPNAQYIVGTNPQRRDGKQVDYLLHEVNQVIYPWWRINFIQILPDERADDLETFVRE
jgi:hypothetical protein